MFQIPTVDDWFALYRTYGSDLEVEQKDPLKTFGVMKCVDFVLNNVERNSGGRVLEFGHGFNHRIMSYLSKGYEVWGCDEDQHLDYFSAHDWEEKYQEDIVDKCEGVHLFRGLIGHDDILKKCQLSYFDVICSVSVLEELTQEQVAPILAQSWQLLKKGGWFIGTFDIHMKNIGLNIPPFLAQLTRHRLDVGQMPSDLSLDWMKLLLESPVKVMLVYQMHQPPEERVYDGHWATMFFAAQKVMGPTE